MALDFDYVTVAEMRNAAQSIESDDLTDLELHAIANQFSHQLHQEVGATSQYTNATAKWNIAKTYVLEKSAAFILDQYPDNSTAAERHEDRAEKALNSLKKKGKLSKTSGINNYA